MKGRDVKRENFPKGSKAFSRWRV